MMIKILSIESVWMSFCKHSAVSRQLSALSAVILAASLAYRPCAINKALLFLADG
ncbi:hypothetical protein [Crinalium epipsammum]|uniref:hypothetical protein n=1 Tax=Crinalium epipsammum TaxID=241425 RepID=UPI0012FC90C2|nr:hypothetical protein [Crinalium epipsammum]